MVALERFASTLAAGPHEPDELPRRFTTIATATIGVATPPPSHPAAEQRVYTGGGSGQVARGWARAGGCGRGQAAEQVVSLRKEGCRLQDQDSRRSLVIRSFSCALTPDRCGREPVRRNSKEKRNTASTLFPRLYCGILGCDEAPDSWRSSRRAPDTDVNPIPTLSSGRVQVCLDRMCRGSRDRP